MQLHSLTYMSTAKHVPNADEFDRLVTKAQARNEMEGVTGALIYSEGSFIQCIEGDKAAVLRIYEFIKADPLHHHIMELLSEPIEAREFSQWSMTLRTTGASFKADLLSDLLHQKLIVVPNAASPARHLLSSFWNGGFGTGYNGNAAAAVRKTSLIA